MKKKYLKFAVLITLFLSFFVINDLSAQIEISEPYPSGLIIPEEVKDYWETREPQLRKSDPIELAGSIDWSGNDSPVKNQKSCGSCWAFAAIALIENLGTQNDLSEQVIVSCTSGSCGGGWYGYALAYVHDEGVPPENCYSYLAQNGLCSDKCDFPDFLERTTNFDRWGRWGVPNQNTVNNLKTLLQSGPVVVAMLVPTDVSFNNYSGGIYDYDGDAIPSNRGHAILAVGYNDSEGYFKAKNSWGKNWGENGYFRIAYDDVTDYTQFGGYACIASGVYTEYVEPEVISKPDTPAGETTVNTGQNYTYTTGGAVSDLGHTVEYSFNWGDGSSSNWSTSTSASHTYYSLGQKTITVTARCQSHHSVTNTSDGLIINIQEPEESVSQPGTPSGECYPFQDITHTYSTSGATSNVGHTIEYSFNWGDGANSEWSTSKSASHQWSSAGYKHVSVTARCKTHPEKSAVSNSLVITICEPETITKPGTPDGELNPVQNINYTYTTSGATSNLGHTLQYKFYWGDGTNSSWSTSTSASHKWSSLGSKNISVKARCKIHPEITNPSNTLNVTVQEPEEVISKPERPEGEIHCTQTYTYTYTTTGASSNLGHPVEYRFIWGDGTISDYSTATTVSHTWTTTGTMIVQVRARCKNHTEKSKTSAGLTVIVEEPESISEPVISSGELYPTINSSYIYSCSEAVSNIGHLVEYCFDWGDSTCSSWSDSTNASHTWSDLGVKPITVTARCKIHTDTLNTSDTLIVLVEEPEIIPDPGLPEGELFPTRDTVYVYTTSGTASNLGHPLEYSFNWGDSTSSVWSDSCFASHSWSKNGPKMVTVTVRCSFHPDSMITSDTLIVTVEDPEVISVPGIPAGELIPTRDINYIYTTTGATSNLGHIIEYSFDFGNGICSYWSESDSVSYSWPSTGIQLIKVKARCKKHPEKMNVSDSIYIEVKYPAVNITLNTNPEGLLITVDDSIFTTPTTFYWVPEDTHTIEAPSPQDYRIFNAWSDNGDQIHQISVPISDSTYTAYFGLMDFELTTSVNDTGTGSIHTEPEGLFFPAYTIVYLTAIPESGYYFSHWSGGLDSSANPNMVIMDQAKDITANFRIIDNLPPRLSSCYPAQGAKNVPVNAPVQFKIRDDIYGIDSSSIQVFINEIPVISEGKDQTGGQITIKEINKDFWIIYEPVSALTEEKTVNVRVRCQDKFINANCLDTTYSYKVYPTYVATLVSDLVCQDGGILFDDSTGIQILIPPYALVDTLMISIGVVDNIPPLPDTLESIGKAFHFSPDGLQLNDSFSVYISYADNSSDSLQSTDFSDLLVYYYSSLKGLWENRQNIDLNNGILSMNVCEFCYLTLAKEIEEVISKPDIPAGETNVFVDSLYEFSTESACSNRNRILEYQFDWGDSSFSSWSIDTTASHYWEETGMFSVTVTVRSRKDTNKVSTSDTLHIEVINPMSDVSQNMNDFNLPEDYRLSQNFPNPFNPQTTIKYQIPVSDHVVIEVFNLMGQKIATLVNESKNAGFYDVLWDGKDDYDVSVSSGIYVYIMRSGNYVKKMKTIFLK
jgi:hypothetical protein